MAKLDNYYRIIEDSIGNLILRNDEDNAFILILNTISKEVITFNGNSGKDAANMNKVTMQHLGKKYFYYENGDIKYRVGGLK